MTNKKLRAMARISGRTAAEKVRLSACGRSRRWPETGRGRGGGWL